MSWALTRTGLLLHLTAGTWVRTEAGAKEGLLLPALILCVQGRT